MFSSQPSKNARVIFQLAKAFYRSLILRHKSCAMLREQINQCYFLVDCYQILSKSQYYDDNAIKYPQALFQK